MTIMSIMIMILRIVFMSAIKIMNDEWKLFKNYELQLIYRMTKKNYITKVVEREEKEGKNKCP